MKTKKDKQVEALLTNLEKAQTLEALKRGTPREREDVEINRRLRVTAGEVERERVEQAVREFGASTHKSG